MSMQMRRAANQFVPSRFSFRHFSGHSSNINQKNGLEFVKWHNGGGLFHRTACIDSTVLIENGAIVHSNSVLGADVHIGSGTVVGPYVSIGQSTKVGYNAALSNCSIGMSCIIHNGVCIGQDGFGFFVDEEGRVVKKPQVRYSQSKMAFAADSYPICKGSPPPPFVCRDSSLCQYVRALHILAEELRVKIGNHVEVGANSCIDRGSWRDTIIGDHTKIDNLVQIGHNVVIGKCCILCGQVGIAGSVTMGDYVVMGGRSAIKDHVSIASKVRISGNSGVIKDITEPGDYGGFPAVPICEWRRQCAKLRHICKE